MCCLSVGAGLIDGHLLPGADAAVDPTDGSSAQHLEQDHSGSRIQNLQEQTDPLKTDALKTDPLAPTAPPPSPVQRWRDPTCPSFGTCEEKQAAGERQVWTGGDRGHTYMWASFCFCMLVTRLVTESARFSRSENRGDLG